MTTTVAEADATLVDSVLHGGSGYALAKRHRALRASGNHFLRETGMSRIVSTVTAAADTDLLDIGESVAGFLPGHLYARIFISSPAADKFKRLQVVPFDNIAAAHERGSASGRPELIAFLSPTVAYLYPTPDQEYTLSLPWWQPLTRWTIGTENDPTELNVPDQYVDAWLWWGARAYLLMGAPGHPDAGPAMQKFEEIIAEAKGAVHQGGVWFGDRDDNLDASHQWQGFV